MSSERWVGVGRSEEPGSRITGTAAAAGALQGDDPKLILAFCSSSHDLDELLAGIVESSGAVPVIGCSTGGVGDGGVVVAAFGGPGFSAASSAATDASSDLRAAGAQAAGCVNETQGHPESSA
jgi:hypothetical protein